MTDTVSNSKETRLRRRGRKPADASERRAKVLAALTDLQESQTPFSMNDVAERAGISRATLYRDAFLRDLVGNTGEGPVHRPISQAEYEKQKTEREKLVAERKVLRRRIKEQDTIKAGLEREIEKLEAKIAVYSAHFSKSVPQDTETIRKEAFAEGFSQGVRTAMGQRGGGNNGARRPGVGVGTPISVPSGLASVASQMPKPTLQSARRNLARVLHPDLFASDDPATAALATELLKQLNALAAPDEKRADSS